MRPFIGSVAASARVAPSGIGTTEAAGTTSSSCCAPPSGRRGLTAAITSSPTLKPVDAGSDRLDHAGGVHPGTHGAGRSPPPRWRRPMSVGLTAAALTAIRTSPSPGVARGTVGDLEDVEVPRLGDDDGAQGSDLLCRCRDDDHRRVRLALGADDPAAGAVAEHGFSPGCAGERYSISTSIDSGSASSHQQLLLERLR